MAMCTVRDVVTASQADDWSMVERVVELFEDQYFKCILMQCILSPGCNVLNGLSELQVHYVTRQPGRLLLLWLSP